MNILRGPTGIFWIARGDTYFAFFVDHNSSSWTKKRYEARQYTNQTDAELGLQEIRHRAKMRRIELEREKGPK